MTDPQAAAGNSSPAQSRGRVIDVFVRYLKAEGANLVFGIPGGLLHPLFAAIEADPELRLVVSKHEEGAAFMADGYARATGRLAVCAGTAGPGSTNMLTGVACAFADGVPMLVVTGQAAHATLGKGAAQETPREDIDIVAMFKPVTKYSTMITSPQSLGHHLRRALRLALTGRQGPVHLNVPIDLWEQEVDEDWFDPSTYRCSTSTFDRAEVQRAAQFLVEARRPVILVGSGIANSRAQDSLRGLAEMLPARVATTPRAKGLFPEDSPLSLGVAGTGGHRDARDALLGGEVDLLLTIGASLNEHATFNWDTAFRRNALLLQLDVDADRIGRNYRVDVPLVGDAQTILIELLYHVHRMLREGAVARAIWPNLPPLVRDHQRYLDPELRTSDAVPVTPQRWRCDLERVLPDNALVFSDIGGHMLFNLHHLCIRGGQRFFINLGFASMGHGTVAAIGAACAKTDQPVVAIVGDGCFAMNGMELTTAVEQEVAVIWIVENNKMHAITWHGSKLVGNRRPMQAARYRRPLEIAAIARAMGLGAWVVDEPDAIQEAFVEALSTHAPAVIEVRVDGTIPPPLGDRARALAGFIER